MACAAILIQFIDNNHRQYAQITVRDAGDRANTLTTLDHEAAKEFILKSDEPSVTALPRTLISKRLLSDVLFRDEVTPQLRVYRPVVEAWREHQVANSDDDVASNTAIWKAAESVVLTGRIGIVSGEGNGAIYQRHLGSGLTFLTNEERRQLIGRRLSAQPDREFGCWVEAELDWCLRSGEPQLFTCSGIIKSSEDRRSERRDWYRLTLPLASSRLSDLGSINRADRHGGHRRWWKSVSSRQSKFSNACRKSVCRGITRHGRQSCRSSRTWSVRSRRA